MEALANADTREATRRDLARRAAAHEPLQAEVKAALAKIKEHEQEEKARQLAAQTKAKALQVAKAKAMALASDAAGALEKLRQEYVPLSVRHDLSEAKRGESADRSALTRATQDLSGARESLERIRHRIKTVPSAASAADLREAIKREEDALVRYEAEHARALEVLAAAEARLAAARASFDAAMAAARAL